LKAVVLAAGEGVRLRPLTNTRPKHLLPIGGKPVLEHVLQVLKNSGVHEALIVVHYMANAIKEFFGDGTELGLKLNYVVQSNPSGTADAVAAAESFVQEDFLVVYGDLFVTSKVVRKVLQAHKREKPSATMAVVPVENPEHYGVVNLEESYVTGIIEKPKFEAAPSNLANAGIYVFSTKIFDNIKKTKLSKRREFELTDTLNLLINEGAPVLAVRISNQEWLDIGRPWDLLEANRRILDITEPYVLGDIESGAKLIGAVTVAEEARVRSGAYIEGPVFIDKGADVGPNCYVRPYTSIGKNVRIGNACEIKNSVIMDGTHVGHLSYVGDSIIGENCNLGAGTTIANLRFDSKTVKVMIKGKPQDSGRTKLGVILGDNVKTGVNVSLMPGVKVGNDSWIGAGVVVYKDVPSKSFLLLKQETEQKEKPD